MVFAVRQLKRFFLIFKEAIKHWQDDDAQWLAAALSYYATFSLAPSLIIVIEVVALIMDQNRAETEVVHQVELLVGSDAAQLAQQMIADAITWEGNLLTTGIGLATLLIGASGAFSALQGALNQIWGVRAKPNHGVVNFLRTRAFSFVILLMIGFILMLSVVVSTMLVLINDWFSRVMPGVHFSFSLGDSLISYAVILLLFALLYKVMPDVVIRWHDIWVGAAVTALLFNFGKWAIGFYLGNTEVASTFGAAGALVAVLIWVYYSAQIVLFGAEFIKVFATQRGRAVLPARHAVHTNWTPEDTLTE
jgi:membrane protein